jgi:hypothetical protein
MKPAAESGIPSKLHLLIHACPWSKGLLEATTAGLLKLGEGIVCNVNEKP